MVTVVPRHPARGTSTEVRGDRAGRGMFDGGLDPKNQTFHDAHRFPVHSIYRVKAIGDQLNLAVMNIRELAERLEEDPDVVDHVIAAKRLLLTAPTGELQKFLASNKDSFDGSIDLDRKSS